MYPFHPATVHLPIGLLIGNAILTMLYLRRHQPSLEQAAYHCLWLGWLLTLPAVLTGVYEAVRHVTAGDSSDTLGWINAHALTGLAVMVVYWQARQLRRRNPHILSSGDARRGYLIRLGLGVVLLVASGWLGGHLVYELRVGVDR